MGSSSRRGAYVGAGIPGVRAVRQGASSSAAVAAAAAPTPGDLSPVYWYDAADASTSDWAAHAGAGSLLTATGTPTLVPAAVNGEPGVRLDTSEHYGGTESTTHLFASGLTFLYVVKMGTNPGSYVEMYGGADTSYFMTDVSFGELTLSYTDDASSNKTATYNAPAGSTAYVIEATIGPTLALSFAGVAQTPTSTSGSAGSTAESVEHLQIGNAAQSPTVCELGVFDAADAAGLSDFRSFLATKYGLTA